MERDRRQQFERERARILQGTSNETPAAPCTDRLSHLGVWLASLDAAEYEDAFRDQQFETVEEIVEARYLAFSLLARQIFGCTGSVSCHAG